MHVKSALVRFSFFTLVFMLSCRGLLAGQQPSGRAYSTPDLFNQEAQASDPAGIHKYSRDLIGLIVPKQVDEKYIDTLSDRLASAELLVRRGKGKLIPEADVVRAYNDLMRRIGAPSSFKADEADLRMFRAHSIDVPSLTALISANRNETYCNPGEAVYLLYTLLSYNGASREDLLDEVETLRHDEAAQPKVGSVAPVGAISFTTIKMSDQVKGRLSLYSVQHNRHATIKLFNHMAQTLHF